MSKKILVISTSLRSKSNSEALADAFIKGAREGGNSVEKITLQDKRIAFCKGCLACQKRQKCVIDDDAVEIVQKMHDAETIVFATPLYAAAAEPKEMYVVDDAEHIDLYDKRDRIPFEKLHDFFAANLKMS